MQLQLYYFNIWAVLVSIICFMVIGALWYSPILFGNTWLKLVGKSKDDIKKEDANKSMMLSIIPAIITTLVLSVILGFTRAATVSDALIVGTLTSIGFIGMSTLNLVFFEDRPFSLSLLNTGYSFVAMNIGAVIMTLWQ